MGISSHKYEDLLWKGELPFVSPRPGVYLSFCPACHEWRPLITRAYPPGQLENSEDPLLVTSIAGAFTADGTVPLVDAANQPMLCLKCTERAWGQYDGMSEDELAEAQEAVDGLKSILALIRAGMPAREAIKILGFAVDDPG